LKKLISILTAVFLLSTLIGGATISVSASNSNDGGYDVVLFEDDFEDDVFESNSLYTDATKTQSWTLAITAGNKEKALNTYDSVDAVRGSKGLAHYDENDGTKNQGGKRISIAPATMTSGVGLVKYEFDINLPEGARRYFRYVPNDTPFLDIDCRSGYNRIRLFDGSAGGTAVSYTPGTWVTVGVVLNAATGVADLYIGGEYENSLTFTNTKAKTAATGWDIDTVQIKDVSVPPEGPVLVDNLKISVPSVLTVASTLPADKAENIAPDTTYKITGSRNLNKYDLAGMFVKDSKGADVDYTYTISGKEVTLTFDSMLKLEETYTVSFNGNEYTFTTKDDVPEKIYYPTGITWDTMQYGSISNSAAWGLNNVTDTYMTESNGNRYASVTGAASNSYLDYNIGVEYKKDGNDDNANKYLYYTMQIAGWENGYSSGNLTISPVYANTTAAKAPNAPIYLAKNGAITSSGGKVAAAINPVQESSSLADKFYRIDIIIDMHASTYYIYLDGQKVKEYTENNLDTSIYTGIKAFRISPGFAGRTIKLDNVGYKVYPSTASVASILEEVFPIDRITSLSAYSLDSDNAEGRRYRVVVRGSADEGAGSYLIAAYDKDGKIIDVRNLNGRTNENDQTTMGTYTREGSFVTDIAHGKGLESLSEVKTIKAFLLDMNSLKPVVECATLDSSRFNNYK